MGEECIVLVVILLQRESWMFKQYKMIVQKHVSAMKWIEMDKVKVSLRLLSAPGRDAQHHSNVLVFV